MNEFQTWHNETIGVKTVEALKRNHFEAVYCQTARETAARILELIPADASVGIGGSWTVKELGILDELAGRGNTILNHNQPGLDNEQKMAIRRQQQTCDAFLTSTNAVTSDGRLVNTDGAGNRVAAMIFGPKKVIVVAGINKIVPDVAAAEERIRTIAAPLNNKRLNLPNPCVQSGECMDCQGSGRICNVTVVMAKRPVATDITVFIVGEELGF